MPLRKIVLSDGREVSRNITNVHPNGREFLPEEFSIPADKTERVSRIYSMLAQVIENTRKEEK